MFADDTQVFQETRANGDIQTLQKDLNKLQGWSNKLVLRFHLDKCKVMTISRKKKQHQNKYTMRIQVGNNIYTDHILDMVEREKDLGESRWTVILFSNTL